MGIEPKQISLYHPFKEHHTLQPYVVIYTLTIEMGYIQFCGRERFSKTSQNMFHSLLSTNTISFQSGFCL